MGKRRLEVWVWVCEIPYCRHEWLALDVLQETPPKTCPHCASPNWYTGIGKAKGPKNKLTRLTERRRHMFANGTKGKEVLNKLRKLE